MQHAGSYFQDLCARTLVLPACPVIVPAAVLPGIPVLLFFICCERHGVFLSLNAGAHGTAVTSPLPDTFGFFLFLMIMMTPIKKARKARIRIVSTIYHMFSPAAWTKFSSIRFTSGYAAAYLYL